MNSKRSPMLCVAMWVDVVGYIVSQRGVECRECRHSPSLDGFQTETEIGDAGFNAGFNGSRETKHRALQHQNPPSLRRYGRHNVSVRQRGEWRHGDDTVRCRDRTEPSPSDVYSWTVTSCSPVRHGVLVSVWMKSRVYNTLANGSELAVAN